METIRQLYMKIGSRERQAGLENRRQASQSRLSKRMVSREKSTEKRARPNLPMEIDREGEAGFAGRAWVGHTADTGFFVGMRLRECRDGFHEMRVQQYSG